MSLAIDVNKVDMVLLRDGWHQVSGASFDHDAYEYAEDDRVLLESGTVTGLPTTAATWKEPDGSTVTCPITAILAVKSNGAPTTV